MTDDKIRRAALRHGFTLRPQTGVVMDLNPYVYAFAREMFEAGRTAARAEILPELEKARVLLRDIYDVALERRIHHRNRGSCTEPATGNRHWRDDECPACQVLMRAAASLCETCNGRGEIGGFQGGAAPGYVTELCPDCAGAQHERQEAPAIGLRDCNSKNHGGQAATPQCGYLMRTTDPGCTGCVERDEDQRAEAGG